MTRLRYATGARTLLLSTGLAFGVAAAAQASTLNLNGTFSGTFGAPVNATAPFNPEITGNGSILQWGNINDPRNLLTIISGGFSASLDPANFSDLKLGEVEWYNASVLDGGGKWGLPMSFTIDFFSPAGVAPLTPGLTAQVDNTGDGAGVPLETTNLTGMNPDHITGISFDNFAAVSLGGGWSVTGLYAARVGDTGAKTQCGTEAFAATTGVPADQGSAFDAGLGTWTNCENTTASLGIYATFSYTKPEEPEEPVAPIPLPAAGWLLLGGLAGLGALRARRKTAA